MAEPATRVPIGTVVFDIGHVLIDWDPRLLYAKLIDDGAERERFVTEVVSTAWHRQHDLGRPFAETSAELIAEHPHHRALIEAFGPRFGEMIPGPMAGMPALLTELNAAGVALFAITNFSNEFWPPVRARFAAMFDRFRDILVSGEARIAKPDPAIYALALERFGLEPGEALFVDDRAENVRAAAAAGFLGVPFTGAEALRARLRALGVMNQGSQEARVA